MTGADALDELRNNLLRDISDSVSGESDTLWSDAALLRYLNDAYERFASETRLLRDNSTEDLTRITLEAGTDIYSLDRRVLSVLSACIAGQPNMAQGTFDTLEGSSSSSTSPVIFGPVGTGRPRWFSTDEAAFSIRFAPVPDVDAAGLIVQLRVVRLPLRAISLDNLDKELELPRHHHLDVIEGAAYRALRNHDVDANNMVKAERHKARFDEAVEAALREGKKRMLSGMKFAVDTRW